MTDQLEHINLSPEHGAINVEPNRLQKPLTPELSFIAMVERAASDPTVDIDKMERLFTMGEKMMDRKAVAEYNKDMTLVQKNIPTVIKTGKNTQTGSTYAKLENIINAIRPVYTKHGFSVSFSEGEPSAAGLVRANMVIRHKGGHKEHSFYESPMDIAGIKDNRNKTDTHGKASAMSYAQRYALNGAFLLEFSDDDDGNDAGKMQERITDAQVETIGSLLADNGVNPEAFFAWLLSTKGVKFSGDIPASEYKSVIRKINATINAMKEKASDSTSG
jgi:hypothetical protein